LLNPLMPKEPTMIPKNEQLASLNQASVETASRYATIALTGAAQLAKLQLEAAKATLLESTGNTKALLAVSEPQDMIALRSQIAEAQVKSAVNLARNVYEIAMQTQAEFAKLAEQHFAGLNQTMVAALDQAGKSAPGADVAIAGIKSTLAATTAAMDTMSKAAKQVSNLASANFKAAADATTKAATRA
jgi:phasin family protein